MSAARTITAPVRHADRLFIDGAWVDPSSDVTIDVIDSGTEELYYRVAAAGADDISRAVASARRAFDEGPWPRMTHAERADVLRAIADGIQERGDVLGQLWPRETGTIYKNAQYAGRIGSGAILQYAALADTFAWEEECPPTAGGEFGLLVREPVGVVGAIIPWNAPVALISHKLAPALLAGCTVVLKSAPEAPGEGYVFAEVAEAVGLPPGVLNVVTADREVSELLVRDAGVDKITFTGSTAAGRRIASLCGERIARCTLELGGKSAAVVLDDMDLGTAAKTLARAECALNGQVCSSLTRVIVTKHRHDELVDALASTFSQTRVGDPFDEQTQLGPLVSERQRDRVEGYIAKGVDEGATLAAGGGRPRDLGRGYYVEPTVFGNVDNGSTIGREEIFGPVLSVIAADSEQDAVRTANDTVYGLNASVFTNDVDRARAVARELRSGTVGHNAFRTDFGMAFGGFKQSGIGREGGKEGLLPFLETKAVILEGTPEGQTARTSAP
jgi:aldehyde dehydrogenase (NAD+)